MSELKNRIHHNLMSLTKYMQHLLKSSTHFCLINVTRTTPRPPIPMHLSSMLLRSLNLNVVHLNSHRLVLSMSSAFFKAK